MTRIDFYTDVAALYPFACRAARTVYRKGERMLIVLPDEAALRSFSAQLWAYGDTEFIPHCAASDALAAETPVLLATDFAAAAEGLVLLNLSPAFPDSPQRFPRILEVVGSDDASKATARQRYRRYLDSGFEIHHHNMSDARHD
ncbi:DNA polymerase III subunit chi [Vogesella alkaliphila]|uniref:DNA polymerase III subunit chi n=1 Tax=Vogesella alkaliphila TaxID=1193621 RepID=A0ABQ2YD97_9NEIS|nr:DNA polymerase III subunit chi [Vogesella alkaliphila]GGX80548.1 DNA polymerase III subunit chi [Vogesella alkaliphila]